MHLLRQVGRKSQVNFHYVMSGNSDHTAVCDTMLKEARDLQGRHLEPGFGYPFWSPLCTYAAGHSALFEQDACHLSAMDACLAASVDGRLYPRHQSHHVTTYRNVNIMKCGDLINVMLAHTRSLFVQISRDKHVCVITVRQSRVRIQLLYHISDRGASLNCASYLLLRSCSI